MDLSNCVDDDDVEKPRGARTAYDDVYIGTALLMALKKHNREWGLVYIYTLFG